MKKPNLKKLRDGKLKELRVNTYVIQLPMRRLKISLKKRLSKSIALALVGISMIIPTLNTVSAMENNLNNNEISYEEVISNIDYNEINRYNNERGIISKTVLKIFNAIPKKIRLAKEPFVDLAKFSNKNGKVLRE